MIRHGNVGIEFGSASVEEELRRQLASVPETELTRVFDKISGACEGEGNGVALKAQLVYLDAIVKHVVTVIASGAH